MKVTTLLYHDVAPEAEFASTGFSGPGAALYKLDTQDFQSQRDRMVAARVGAPVLAPEMYTRVARSEPWMFTVDDGGVSSYSVIAPLLEEVGWRGHFFVTTDRIGFPEFVSESQIRELHHRGHVVGSHTASHPQRMSRCSESQLLDEWRKSGDRLAEILGTPTTVASVPGGYYSRRVAETAAAAGIRYLFNSEPVRRPQTVNGCVILGRFCVKQATSLEEVLALATGTRGARTRQWLGWNSRKVAKTMGGKLYLDLQRAILGLRG